MTWRSEVLTQSILSREVKVSCFLKFNLALLYIFCNSKAARTSNDATSFICYVRKLILRNAVLGTHCDWVLLITSSVSSITLLQRISNNVKKFRYSELFPLHPSARYNGLFRLPVSDSDSDSDSDSKPYRYMVLCRKCFHWLRFRFGSLSHSICIVQESESESANGNKP